MHFPALYLPAPTEEPSSLQAARGYSIPCLDTSQPAPPVLPLHSNSCPWGSTYPADMTRHHHNGLPVTCTNYSNSSATPLLHISSVLSLRESQLPHLLSLLGKSWLLITFPGAQLNIQTTNSYFLQVIQAGFPCLTESVRHKRILSTSSVVIWKSELPWILARLNFNSN